MIVSLKTFFVFLILISFKIFSAYGQTSTDCPRFNKETALKDIKNLHPKLLLIGGIAAKYYPDDRAFCKKYGISFYDFGCTPDIGKCIVAYNETIFEYLDKNFGETWRKEVRPDVIGLKKNKPK